MIRDPYFHTEDSRRTRTRLLQKVETFTDAQEGNAMHSARGVQTYEQKCTCTYLFFSISLCVDLQRQKDRDVRDHVLIILFYQHLDLCIWQMLLSKASLCISCVAISMLHC